MSETAPYGTWTSPVSTELVAGRTIGLSMLRADGADLLWLESRPVEQGRSVLVRRTADGAVSDLTPAPLDVASRVHEYGGGAYAAAGGRVVFSHKKDGSAWLIERGGEPRAVAAVEGCRYADFALLGARWAVCVREDGRRGGEPEAAVVALDLLGGREPGENEGRVLARGAGFYAAPRPSPDGTRLALVEWDHPDMPWDATRLRVLRVDAETAAAGETLALVDEGASVVAPGWLGDGTLLACSDAGGWWNLHRLEGTALRPLHPMEAEVGGPHWAFGMRPWCELPDGRLLAQAVREGRAEVLVLSPDGGSRTLELEAGDCPVVVGDGAPAPPGSAAAAGEDALPGAGVPEDLPALAWIAATAEAPPAVVMGRPGDRAAVLRRSAPAVLGPADVSRAEAVRFPAEDGGVAHAWFYPPANARFRGPEGERPPLVVISHGGPTAMSGSGFSPRVQWWTSRGFAVADVNYGGSTGFGRAYRQRLDGRWGVVDVADCVSCARFLAESGRVDGARMAIRGGSAGGFTVLAALVGSDAFRAGASHYGVADLRLLAADTHKFESRYLDRLVGPLPGAEAVYVERSPLTHVERLRCPVIFFQGLEDRVVPPNQARVMVEAMRARGVPAAHYEFEGEGHGFRQAGTMRRVLELELDFFGQVFGFVPAGGGERAAME